MPVAEDIHVRHASCSSRMATCRSKSQHRHRPAQLTCVQRFGNGCAWWWLHHCWIWRRPRLVIAEAERVARAGAEGAIWSRARQRSDSVESLCDVQRLRVDVESWPATHRTGSGRAWTSDGASTGEQRRRQAERTTGPSSTKRASWQMMDSQMQTQLDAPKRDARHLEDACVGQHTLATWTSTQKVVPLSSAEFEFNSMMRCASKAIGLANTIRELGHEARARIWTDAAAARGLALRNRSGVIKHIET